MVTFSGTIDEALFPTADFWHAVPQFADVPSGFKEWSHFSVLAPEFDLLVNFSLMSGAVRSGRMTLTPRLTVLVATADGAWNGDIEQFGPSKTAIREGYPSAVLGRSAVRFTNGHYRLEIALSNRPVTVALKLRPVARPVIANNVRLSRDESVRWMVVPHLRASGDVTVSNRRYNVNDAPAYHDRNWGRFAWGGAYAWEWATILPVDPSSPWCLVYSRISDRTRGATLSQSLILWRREFPLRKFYGRDLDVVQEGLLRPERVLQIPPVGALALAGSAADVPRQMTVAASGYGDRVELHMEFDDFAQVVVPNDHWPGLTTLSETRGRAVVTGTIAGQHIAFSGRVQAELNNAAG